ncbi:MAG TPA: hypothetical protein VFQ78_05545 [Candidatus Udaeobacter sp.]|jgi:hypothetical protein|nr:hypothetical protein [Candidatus Udaeobacter sp.]
MRTKLLLFLTVSLLVLISLASSQAQTLVPLVNQLPGVHQAFLLTDGTVMAERIPDIGTTEWWKLTPDITGSYLNGTWSQLASVPYAASVFSSAVLADGRLVFQGIEFFNEEFALSNKGAIYDPITNRWTPLEPPSGWCYMGECPSVVLPDGRWLIGWKLGKRMAALDPVTLTWTEMAYRGKNDSHAEEGWTLLPDGTVLTVDITDAPNSEKYIPWLQTWVTAGSTIVDLHEPPASGCVPYGRHQERCYYPPGEVGPAILRPDGTVFATGAAYHAAGHTAIYTPPAVPTDPGTWMPGPDFPRNSAVDTEAVLLPSGNVLVQTLSGQCYEFNGTKFIPVGKARGVMLLLPTGEVLINYRESKLYTSANTSYSPDWAPRITAYPTTVIRGSEYLISGQQFNGLSQAVTVGDEFQNATNYPLVRITNEATGHVFYARTHHHSTMGVATGNAIVSTHFDVPAGMETGSSSLEVVANAIPSQSVTITVE